MQKTGAAVAYQGDALLSASDLERSKDLTEASSKYALLTYWCLLRLYNCILECSGYVGKEISALCENLFGFL